MHHDSLFDISDETIVVTGTAGLLGAEYARAFLGRGARVAGIDISASERSASLESDFGASYVHLVADVCDEGAIKKAQDAITRQIGSPTVLVNNAAIDSPPDASAVENGPFETYPNSSWDKVMHVNVKGVYIPCKVFGATMAAAARGSIINVSSIYGVVAPDQSIYEYRRESGETFYKPVAYSVSKSAILNLTRYLSVYWGRRNVRVNTLVLAGVENDQDPRFLEAYCRRIPVGRMALKDEYNGAMIFLASSASRYMTGAQLVVDGGWTAI